MGLRCPCYHRLLGVAMNRRQSKGINRIRVISSLDDPFSNGSLLDKTSNELRELGLAVLTNQHEREAFKRLFFCCKTKADVIRLVQTFCQGR